MEKVLLFTDKSELRRTKVMANQAEKEINAFVSLVSRELNRELSREEKQTVINDALGFIEGALNFTLPNATEQLKYEAMGVNIDVVKKAWKTRNWERFDFTQDSKGDFELTEHQPSFEACKKYATPKQLEVLNQAQTLADALNLAVSQGLHSVPVPYKIKETFKVVEFIEKEKIFTPNLNFIAFSIRK